MGINKTMSHGRSQLRTGFIHAYRVGGGQNGKGKQNVHKKMLFVKLQGITCEGDIKMVMRDIDWFS
jgi:hypothetical protein